MGLDTDQSAIGRRQTTLRTAVRTSARDDEEMDATEWMPAEEGTDYKKYFKNLKAKYPSAPPDIFPQ